MSHNTGSNPTVYTALSVVSPIIFGEDEKDQDRARWFGPGQIAVVCDGVTSSPHSAQGAELVTSFAPVMFNGNSEDKLETISSLLMARRQEFQQSELVTPDGTTPEMQDLLKKVIQEKRAVSFQTTIVAAKLVCEKRAVQAHILKCGDSAFFAFSNEGETLSSSLTDRGKGNRAAGNKHTNLSCSFGGMSFGPGDQILVRVEGLLSDDRTLARRTQIENKHLKKWLVCIPIDVCRAGGNLVDNNSPALPRLSLRPSDHLVVPRYLYGTHLKSNGKRYRILDYSSTIRVLSAGRTDSSPSRIAQRSSTTMVLPDHFYGGCVESYEDRFPLGTHFVLCSDGLYTGFHNARYLWKWLRDNANILLNEAQRQSVLRRLHARLNAHTGDDDISFVWAYPRDSLALLNEGVRAADREG